MAERGNRLNRFLDRYIGIPLTLFAALFRRFDRISRQKTKGEKLKVGVICLGAIGDLLLLSGLMNGIKKLYPESETTLFTSMGNSIAAPLIEGADHVFSFPVSKFFRMIKALRKESYDLLIDSTQWARIGALICAFSGAGWTVGFKAKGEARSLAYDESVLHSDLKHEWENFAALLQTDIADLKPKLKICGGETENLRANLPTGEFAVLHTTASGTYKDVKAWKDAYWGELAAYLTNKGFSVVFSGGEEDRPSVDKLIREAIPDNEKVFNLAGRLNLEELSVLLKRSKAVISVNTGIMHLAALSGAFTIGLHGPTNPVRWGPVGDRTIALVPKGVKEFPPMKGNKIKDGTSFTKNIKVSEVTECLNLNPRNSPE
ncbi:MAG: glycosyltransferase family 9 protein [Deferribacteraceae bacterium]|jgi:ADP-heptose:LPS heptosyltransferase|nr:glycosyltransferase family 9 protein [Deferribacteraceae bacterium]